MAGVQNRGAKFEICTTPQPTDLNEAAFKVLSFVDVCCVSELPEFSVEANLLTENCIDGTRLQGVGADESTDFEVSVFYMADCAGQGSLRTIAMAKDGQAYAVRKIYSDGSPTKTPTTVYARVIFTGFNDGGGGIDDFVTHTFSGAVQQDPIFVAPTNITPP